MMHKVKRPKIGEYVLLAHFSDKDIYDPWVVGYLDGIEESKNHGLRYRVEESTRWFNHCWRITEQEASERISIAAKLFARIKVG